MSAKAKPAAHRPTPVNGHNRLAAHRMGVETLHEAHVYMRADCHVCRSEGFSSQNSVLVSHGNTSIVASQPQGAISHDNYVQILSGSNDTGGQSPTVNGPYGAGWTNGSTFNPQTCTSGIPIFNADGSEAEIDSRTSDAIAVAVRTGSTIYVDERVLDEAGVEPDHEDESGMSDEKLEVFREFINSLEIDLEGGEKGPPTEERGS